MKLSRRSLFVFSCLAASMSVHAADISWSAGTGDFSTAGNWAGGVVPGVSDNAVISNSGTVQYTTGNVTLLQLWAGNTGGTTSIGTFVQSGGNLILSQGGLSGRQTNGNGTWTMTGGTLQTGDFRVGGGGATGTAPASSIGTMTVSNLNTVVTSTGYVGVGSAGNGTLTLSDSAVWNHNGTAVFLVGGDNNNNPLNQVGGTGVVNVNSGAQLKFGSSANLSIGRNTSSTNANGDGTLNVNGGTVTLGTGTLNFSSSQGATTQMPGKGTLNLNSGQITAPQVKMNEGNSTLNLNGGTLTTGGFLKSVSAGTGNVNFNGCTIKASAPSSNFFAFDTGTVASTMTLNIQAGGLTFDTNNNAVTIAQPLNGSGGLVKTGVGSLVLSVSNGYTGATTVNQGTLALGANNVIANASAVTLNSGTLGLGGFSDSAGALSLSSTSTIDFGSSLGANALIFANSSGASWTGSLTLLNFEVGVDTLSFSVAGGLTGAQLNAIQVGGFTATGLDGNGVVQFAAVPEPSVIGLGLLGAGALVFVRRKRAAKA